MTMREASAERFAYLTRGKKPPTPRQKAVEIHEALERLRRKMVERAENRAILEEISRGTY